MESLEAGLEADGGLAACDSCDDSCSFGDDARGTFEMAVACVADRDEAGGVCS